MIEKFVLTFEIDGVAKRSQSFEKKEIKLLLQGLFYAKTKDYYGKRKIAYGKIYKKIAEVKR